jgi:predicted DNA-binding transcriptional regulator AlpA
MPQLITIKEACARLSVCRSKLYYLSQEPDFPRPVRIGKATRYDAAELADWVERSKVARAA